MDKQRMAGRPKTKNDTLEWEREKAITPSNIASVRATEARMRSAVEPMVRHCCFCEPPLGLATSGLCPDCETYATAPIMRNDVDHLAFLAQLAWGRYMVARGDAAEELATFERANRRARTALRLMTEDYEREIRRLTYPTE